MDACRWLKITTVLPKGVCTLFVFCFPDGEKKFLLLLSATFAMNQTVSYLIPPHWAIEIALGTIPIAIFSDSIFVECIGGVRCLAILNIVFAIIFGLLALFLGSSLLTLGSSCSVPLFWCYELSSWGLVILYGGTAFFLRRKAAAILDEGEFGGRNLGLEMLEANPLEVTPDIERWVNEGFKSWMGASFLSSDEEEEPESYMEAPQLDCINSTKQSVWVK